MYMHCTCECRARLILYFVVAFAATNYLGSQFKNRVDIARYFSHTLPTLLNDLVHAHSSCAVNAAVVDHQLTALGSFSSILAC